MTRKQTKILLLLFALIAVLLIALRPEKAIQGDLDLPGVEEVTGIRIENREGIFVASRRGGEWTVNQPARGLGDPEALDDLILMGSRLRVEATFPNGERSHYGLNPPAALLELRGGTTATQIAFGKRAPAHYASYIQVDNGPVLAVKGYPIETVEQPFENLFDEAFIEGL
ncbi:MAG: hypothetical protein VXW32_02400 [Myxococcota bacterium]|nr:hypothetical protein [Myxococcota bacterium]